MCCLAAKVASAAASPAAEPAAAQAEASAAAADAAVRQALPADAATGVMASGAGTQPLAACMQDKKDTGATAPRTGTTDRSPSMASSQPAAPSNALAGPSIVPPDLQPTRALPGRNHRPASAPPTASGSPSLVGKWTPAVSSNRGSKASPSRTPHQLSNGQAHHVQPPGTLARGAVQHASAGHVNGNSSLANGSSQLSNMPATLGHSPHLQINTLPAVGEQQHEGQQADADDDNDSLEDGEIEEGEVLPDGTVAGATSNAPGHDVVHDASNSGHADGDGISVVTKSMPSASSHKRPASSDLADGNGLHVSKMRTMAS